MVENAISNLSSNKYVRLTKTVKRMLWSVPQLGPNGLDVGNYWISIDYDCNCIHSPAVPKHVLSPLEHFDCVMDAVAIHLRALDYCIDDSNRTWENYKEYGTKCTWKWHRRKSKVSQQKNTTQSKRQCSCHISFFNWLVTMMQWKLSELQWYGFA